MNIWKVSQSPKHFKQQEYKTLLRRNCVCVHPETPAKGSASVTQGDDFYNVNKGDYFYLCYGNNEIRLFGRFTGVGAYSKLNGKSDWYEQQYELLFESIKKEKYQGAQWWWTPNDNSTFIKVKNNEDFEQLILKPFFSKTLNDIITMENTKSYQTLLLNNHNIILTGAPGTGKTYLAKQIAKEITHGTNQLRPLDILKTAIDGFVPDEIFNSSKDNLLRDFYVRFPKAKLKEMTLDDYCIGKGEENKNNFCYWIERKLKPLGYYFPRSSESYLIYWNKKENEYKVHGYLKSLATDDIEEKMKTLAKDIQDMVNNDNPDNYTEKFGAAYMLKILNTYYPEKYAPINSPKHIDNIIAMFDIHCDSKNVFEKNQVIYDFYRTLCGGKNINIFEFMNILYNNFNIKDGETLTTTGVLNNSGRWSLVQFHPSYDYTDFVEGLRPIKEEGSKEIGFVRMDGIFKELCVEAKKNPNKIYVLIIDEINRGEISKIFGELFYSIDPGYRGEDGRVKTQYQNLVKDDDEFYDGFYVPNNVYIIGTMNDIDRSVESMDFAFRRRFAFKEIKADDRIAMLDDLDWKDDAIKRMQAINARIEKIDGLSRAYHIGPAYFLKLKKYDGDFDLLWENHLEGLLLEYMRGMTNCKEEIKELAKIYRYTKMDRYE